MTVAECEAIIKAFMERCNDRRNHSFLDNHSLSDVYFNCVVLNRASQRQFQLGTFFLSEKLTSSVVKSLLQWVLN